MGPLDLLGAVRLLRRVLGHLRHRRVGPDHVVPEVLHALPAGLDHQHRTAGALRRGAARRRLHLHLPFLQHAFPHREIPDGHGDLLRTRFQGRDVARTPPLV